MPSACRPADGVTRRMARRPSPRAGCSASTTAPGSSATVPFTRVRPVVARAPGVHGRRAGRQRRARGPRPRRRRGSWRRAVPSTPMRGHAAVGAVPGDHAGLPRPRLGARRRPVQARRLPPEALRTLARRPRSRYAGPVPRTPPRSSALLRRLHAATRDCGPIDRREEYFAEALADEDVYCLPRRRRLPRLRLARRATRHRGRRLRRRLGGDRTRAVGDRRLRVLDGRVRSAPASRRDDPVLWLLRDRSEDDLTRVHGCCACSTPPPRSPAAASPQACPPTFRWSSRTTQRAGNAGAWRLTVGGGSGPARTRRRPGRATRRGCTARGLAALYAGVRHGHPAPLRTARRRRRAPTPASTAAFAATPYMLDYF